MALVIALAAGTPTASLGDAFSGPIVADTTWSGDVSVTGDVVVEPGAVLTILPGTTVLFTAGSTSFDHSLGIDGLCDMIVRGAVTALGGPASSDSIRFDSDAASPAPGDWGKIIVSAQATDSLCQYRYMEVQHGTVGIDVQGDQIFIDHCRLAGNSDAGMEWSDPPIKIFLSSMVFESNASDGLRVVTADSLEITDCHFRDNASAGLALTEWNVATVSLCTFDGNGSGLEGSGGGLANLTSCSVTGSVTGVSVSAGGSAGGLHLEGSTVSGVVEVTGSGTVEVLGNPSLESVSCTATDGVDSLEVFVNDNSVSGWISLRSDGSEARLSGEVRRNVVSGVSLYAGGYINGDWAYMTAVVDSNVVSGGTTGIRIQASKYNINYRWYGRIDATLTRNEITGSTYGINAFESLIYPLYLGILNLTSAENVITGSPTGIRLDGFDSASFDGDVITACETGIDCSGGGDLTMRSCGVTGNAVKGLIFTNSPGVVLGGSLAEANDIYANTGQNVETTDLVEAAYNYWGTTDEDSLVAMITGPVNYSPWTDASHTGVYATTYRSGLITGIEHWSGEVKVAGDVLVPFGSSLTIDPGMGHAGCDGGSVRLDCGRSTSDRGRGAARRQRGGSWLAAARGDRSRGWSVGAGDVFGEFDGQFVCGRACASGGGDGSD